jgi:hypothetical protein
VERFFTVRIITRYISATPHKNVEALTATKNPASMVSLLC